MTSTSMPTVSSQVGSSAWRGRRGRASSRVASALARYSVHMASTQIGTVPVNAYCVACSSSRASAIVTRAVMKPYQARVMARSPTGARTSARGSKSDGGQASSRAVTPSQKL
ncbi:MAG: hypothetical protein QM777_04040 [Pseudorhodoferax sp.]